VLNLNAILVLLSELNGSSITNGSISTADECSAHYSLELGGHSTIGNEVPFLPKPLLGDICTTSSDPDIKLMAIKEECPDSDDLTSKGMQSYRTKSAEFNASHVCEMCGECFQHLSELGDHQSRRHGTTRPMNCRHCGREFTRLRALEQHELRHTEGNSHTCKVCDIVFISNCELTRHRRQQHTVVNNGPFHCNICDKDLNSAIEHATHRAMHRERVPCPECGKTFTLERSMRAHMLTFHSDKEIVKPFECDICGHSFVRANLMVIHRRTHTGEKPFQCEVCGRRFICRGDLNKHTRLHVDGYMYKCKICDREIKTSRESADHRRMHTSGIICPICGKSFTRYMNMQAHVRGTHEGERRYKCEECEKTFVYAQNLRYHRRKHQGGACRPAVVDNTQ